MSEPDEERLHQLVKNALHDSVSADRLIKKKGGITSPWLNDRALWSYLNYDEQPHFIFYADSLTPDFFGPQSPEEMDRSRPYKVMHMITDSRWIMVAGNRSGDQHRKIPLQKIGAVNFETQEGISKRLSNREYVFESKDNDLWCKVPLSNDFDYEDIEKLSQYLNEKVDAEKSGVEVDPDEAGYTVDGEDSLQANRETIAVLLDEVPPEAEDKADEIIADTDNAAELVTELNTLIEEYEEENRSIDDLVAEAKSADGLRRDVESPLESLQRKAGEELSGAKQRVRAAEPAEVGEWSTGFGRSMLPVAYAAPYSTPVLMASSLALGGAAGVYQSGTENTILDDVDPQELARHAEAMAEKGSDLENINGDAVGAILGASQYLGQNMAPDEYVEWFVQADVESILEGAEMGAAFATSKAINGTRHQGAFAGATLGLVQSYGSSDAVKNTVDEDIYKEYLEQLARKDLSLPD